VIQSAPDQRAPLVYAMRFAGRALATMANAYNLGTLKPTIDPTCWIAPNAAVVGNVVLKESASVWFGVTIRGDNPEPIEVGRRTNIQDGTVLHADLGSPLVIGDDVTVGHQAMLHGCTIGRNSLIGIGATVLNGAQVGENCLIGAHSLIPEGKVIPDGSLVVGSPGKVIKQLSDEQIKGLSMSAQHYVDNAARFRDELSPADE
jgi:carbonic anhydrase/acetyltransferase-like protein (isoleucine patch superfamily)